MKVCFDYQCFVNDKVGGISKYFTKIINHFDGDSDINVEFAGKYVTNLYAPSLLIQTPLKMVLPNLNFKGNRKILKEINKRLSIKKILKDDFQIFHPTYYDPYFLEFIHKKKFIITVHDMIHEIFNMNEKFGSTKMLDVKRQLICKSDKVIAVSNSTKKDILKYVDVDPSKIEVVYHGIDKVEKEISSKISVSTLYRKKYFLFVGRRSSYKNFFFMISSLSELLKDMDIDIVCVGGGGLTKQELNILQSLGMLNKVHNHDYVDEDTLYSLYKNAEALIYPSLYEGFGMPLLEAMNNYCPVLSSNASCLPEVGGDAAIYFDPASKASIVNVVDSFVKGSAQREQIIRKGKEHVKSFSWIDTGNRMKDIYMSIN